MRRVLLPLSLALLAESSACGGQPQLSCAEADQNLSRQWRAVGHAYAQEHDRYCRLDRPENFGPCMALAEPNPDQVIGARADIRGHTAAELPSLVPWIYGGEISPGFFAADQIRAVREATDRALSACAGRLQ